MDFPKNRFRLLCSANCTILTNKIYRMLKINIMLSHAVVRSECYARPFDFTQQITNNQ